MSLIQPTRRSIIGMLMAGPAIVRVASIMPVRALPLEDQTIIEWVKHNGMEYIQIKHKCEDGVIRTSLLPLT